mgnify:CR=1 FL=1
MGVLLMVRRPKVPKSWEDTLGLGKIKGATSDMYVIKKYIEKYKGDELMIHLDDDE